MKRIFQCYSTGKKQEKMKKTLLFSRKEGLNIYSSYIMRQTDGKKNQGCRKGGWGKRQGWDTKQYIYTRFIPAYFVKERIKRYLRIYLYTQTRLIEDAKDKIPSFSFLNRYKDSPPPPPAKIFSSFGIQKFKRKKTVAHKN